MSDGVNDRQNQASATTSPVAENRRSHRPHASCRGRSSSTGSRARVSVVVGCTSRS
ncbi:Uncharacterised protein [Mycobacteroides abscessus]|nr:Uncharacterised protein [Mycobacteroides abscessus]